MPAGDRASESRAQILEAASDVFLEAGFERTSIDRIAAVARVSKQTIYEYFPGKTALFEASVREILEMGRVNLASVVPADTVEATLTLFGERLFAGFADSVAFGLFRANIVAAHHFPDLADELHAHRLEMSVGLSTYLEKAIAAGRFAAADPHAAAIRFGGLAVEGSRYFLGMPLPDVTGRNRCVAIAVDLFLNGYRGRVAAAAADPSDAASRAILAMATPPVLDSGVALRLSADKLARLVDAAGAEFLEHGYPGGSIDRIAAAVGVSKATVYRQFGNKEGLLRHMIEREIYASSRAGFAIATHGDAEQDLAALAREVLDWHLTWPNVRMHRLLIRESDLVPDLARRFHDMRVAVVGRALDGLIDAHGLPRPSMAMSRAFYLLATFAVRFLTVRHFPDAGRRQHLSEECARLFLHGLGPA